MTSLCRHLSVVSTGNYKLGHDCRRCVHTADNDATRQFRRVGVGGVYQGHYASLCQSMYSFYHVVVKLHAVITSVHQNLVLHTFMDGPENAASDYISCICFLSQLSSLV